MPLGEGGVVTVLDLMKDLFTIRHTKMAEQPWGDEDDYCNRQEAYTKTRRSKRRLNLALKQSPSKSSKCRLKCHTVMEMSSKICRP